MTGYDGGARGFARATIGCAVGAPIRAWRDFNELPDGFRQSIWNLRDVALIAVVAICALGGGYAGYGAVTGEGANWLPRGAAGLAIAGGCFGIVATILIWSWRYAPRATWADMGFIRPLNGWRSAVGWMILGYIALAIWIIAYSRIAGALGIDTGGAELEWGAALALWTVLMIFVIPIGEELIFRGILLGAMLRVAPAFWAAVISAAVFGAIHLQLGSFAIYFGAGFYLAALYIRSGSLWPGITAHMAHNSISVGYLIFMR